MTEKTVHVAWTAEALATRLRGTGEEILGNVGFRVTGDSAVAFGALLVNSAAEMDRLRKSISDGIAWIPVDERTPDEEYDVLVTNGDIVGVGSCRGYYWLADSIGGHVTHWMPLPEAPK